MSYINSITIEIYETFDIKCPFIKWMEGLESCISDMIDAKIARIRGGNFGDCKSLGNGIFEIRVHENPGYRVYFARINNTVLILCGGIKRTQKKDIEKSKEYLKDYKERFHGLQRIPIKKIKRPRA